MFGDVTDVLVWVLAGVRLVGAIAGREPSAAVSATKPSRWKITASW